MPTDLLTRENTKLTLRRKSKRSKVTTRIRNRRLKNKRVKRKKMKMMKTLK